MTFSISILTLCEMGAVGIRICVPELVCMVGLLVCSFIKENKEPTTTQLLFLFKANYTVNYKTEISGKCEKQEEKKIKGFKNPEA